jgi:predicted Zn-dependent protease
VRLALAGVVLGCAACATVPVQVPPRDRPGVAVEEDEARIWKILDTMEKHIADSGRLHPDPGLEAYLLEVAHRIEPPQVFEAIPFRFRVLRDTRPGAFGLASGTIYVHTGMLARSWEQAQRYVRLEPGNAAGHLLLAEIARRDMTPGWMESALSSYRRAIELDPRAAEAWRGLALVLERKGDAEEARRAFRRYLDLAPDAPDRAHVEAALGGKR